MTNDNDERGRVPDWLLERFAAGALPPAQARDVQDRLGRDPGGQERLAALARSNEEILAAHPPARVAAAVRQRAASPRSARPARSLMALSMVAMAAAALILVLRPKDLRPPAGPPDPRQESGEDRIKGVSGPATLRVYRKAARGAERLADGASARPGDQLQLAYLARGQRFGAVVSVDGAGQVTYHLPEKGARAVALQPGGEVTLPDSYQLDAAPRFERFCLITSDRPFETDGLADTVRGTRPAPAGTEVFTFTVRKE